MISLLTNFNPRSHEGSDAMSAEKVFNADISIHAPTRGATERGRRYFRTTIISIHAPTRGATPCRQKKSSMQIFQSTLPRGERPSAERLGGVLWDFNPRSHEGSDGSSLSLTCSTANFNPRSHEGSDCVVFVTATTYGRISIHAPTRGATIQDQLP